MLFKCSISKEREIHFIQDAEYGNGKRICYFFCIYYGTKHASGIPNIRYKANQDGSVVEVVIFVDQRAPSDSVTFSLLRMLLFA